MPFRHESVYKGYVLPAMIAAGIEPMVWYAFRHFYASACAAADYRIHDVAKWMGHSNIQLTYSTYMHLFVGAHDMDRLDALSAVRLVQPIPTIGVGRVW